MASALLLAGASNDPLQRDASERDPSRTQSGAIQLVKAKHTERDLRRRTHRRPPWPTSRSPRASRRRSNQVRTEIQTHSTRSQPCTPYAPADHRGLPSSRSPCACVGSTLPRAVCSSLARSWTDRGRSSLVLPVRLLGTGLIELDPHEPVIIVNFVTQTVDTNQTGPDGKPLVLEAVPDAKR